VQSEKTENRVEMPMRELLEHSFQSERDQDGEMSRLTFLADYIFDFTTYDDQMSEFFARKAIEVCAAITEGSTFEYIKDTDNYRWFLLMVNMPFFAKRLDWGTSIRGAWWVHEDLTLESCGIWRGDEQVLSVKFSRGEWLCFIRALVAFSRCDGGDNANEHAIPHDPSPAQ